MTRLVLPLLIAAACVALPLSAQSARASLAMLDQLDRGAWELRQPGAGGQAQSICLETGRKLIQLRHPDLACNSVIIEDQPNQVTVQYTCQGHGYGRTHVRRETNSLIQIDSQGIVNGRPFAFAAEGRRVGTCRS